MRYRRKFLARNRLRQEINSAVRWQKHGYSAFLESVEIGESNEWPENIASICFTRDPFLMHGSVWRTKGTDTVDRLGRV